MKKALLVSLGIMLMPLSVNLNAQQPFSIYLESDSVIGLPGLQSFTWAQHNGKWLLFGGRLDGLHRRQPNASFDVSNMNTTVYVVDPVNHQVWSSGLSGLSSSISEQMSSTNMEFVQKGNRLVVAGGYGYSNTSADHITHTKLLVIDVPGLIDAVINSTALGPHIRQVNDDYFAVCGGHLEVIDTTYYLVVGHRFDGRYNPMGGPSYTQTYTNQIRKFDLVDNGTSITVTNKVQWGDAVNLHRRDYNLLPQIMPDGSYGLTIFSGVFQPAVDLPFLNTVNVSDTGYSVVNGFNQYLNQYHSAVIPVYDSAQNEMHSLFMGGISQYFVDISGNQIQNDSVPFVNTISRVTRYPNGSMQEFFTGQRMPGLLGSSAEFIVDQNVPIYKNGVIKWNQLTADTNFIGYVVGGIKSSLPNIFWINDGTQSHAENTFFKVYLVRNSNSTGIEEIPVQDKPFGVVLYPVPVSHELSIQLNGLTVSKNVILTLIDLQGRTIQTNKFIASQVNEKYIINTQGVAAGNYKLIIQHNQQIVTNPFSVVH